MNPIWQTMPTATEALSCIATKKVRLIDLHEQCAARVAAFPVDAWVTRTRYKDERHIELCLKSRVGDLLRGIPYGVKDIIDVSHYPTRGGSRWTDDKPKVVSAPAADSLDFDGGLFVGKTTTCQFACFDPAPTLNPWNATRTPGGSSAGSAAAVATGQCLLAIGTQTGGSIIRPASYCGIYGFKPSFDPTLFETEEITAPDGQVRPSRTCAMLVSRRLDHIGWLARCVADLERAWRSTYWVKAEFGDKQPLPSGPMTRSPRLGVLRDYFWQHAEPSLAAVTSKAVKALMDRGAIVTEVPLPRGWEHVHGWHRTIMAYDCAREHAARFEQSPEHYLPQITSLIREGLAISPVDYAAAVDAQRIFQEDLFATYLHIDALVMPSTPTTAPARTTTGGPMFNSPWSFAHVPALTMPIGLAADGMPCGSQLVRPHGKTQADDFALLQVAGWCEAALNVNLWPELNRRLEAQFPYIQWIDRPC